MTARLAPPQIAMILLCLLMAALFVYQLGAEPSDYVLPEIHLKPRAVALTAPEQFLPPPMSVYDAINERPLFLPSRKPIAVPVAPGTAAVPAGPPPLPAVTLVGVLLGGGNSVAEVKTNGAAFSQAMRVGDALGAWEIAAIGPDHITLRSGTFSQDVHMDAHANLPAQPGAPGAPPSPNQPPGAAQ